MPLVPFPTRGDILIDARGGSRVLRVTGHPEHGYIVLSVWHGAVCTATTRLTMANAGQLADLLNALVAEGAPPEPTLMVAVTEADEPAGQAIAAT